MVFVHSVSSQIFSCQILSVDVFVQFSISHPPEPLSSRLAGDKRKPQEGVGQSWRVALLLLLHSHSRGSRR